MLLFKTLFCCHTIVRASSHSTLDSMEFGRYSDDLDKETNDRVAVLEFELRKALETIKSLRGSLTKATGGLTPRLKCDRVSECVMCMFAGWPLCI